MASKHLKYIIRTYPKFRPHPETGILIPVKEWVAYWKAKVDESRPVRYPKPDGDIFSFEVEIVNGSGTRIILADASDYELLSAYKWVALFRGYDTRIYAGIRGRSIFLPRFLMNIDDPAIHVHHVDLNSLNNRKNNLLPLPWKEHFRLHADLRKKRLPPANTLGMQLPLPEPN